MRVKMTKNKKKILYIISAITVIAALVIYFFFWDYDPDKISRKVDIETYNSYYNKYVHNQISKDYKDCSENEKISVIKKIVTGNDQVLKIVACRNLSKIPSISSYVDLYNSFLLSENDEVASEAIYSIKNIPSGTAYNILKNYIIKKADEYETSAMNSDYLGINILGKNDENIHLCLNEISGKDLDFDRSSVYEINLLFPKGCEYFVSFPNFDDNWDKFTDTKIIAEFKKSESYGDLKKLNILNDYFNFKQIIDDHLGFLSTKAEPGKLFRDDLKFAKYPEGFITATFRGKNIKMFQNLVEALKVKNFTSYVINEEMVNNIHVTRISKGSAKTIYFAEISDYFVISNSKELIHKSIETFFNDHTKSITFDPSFQTDYDKIDLTGKNDFVFARVKTSDYFDTKTHTSYLLKNALSIFEELKMQDNEVSAIKNKYFEYNSLFSDPSKLLSENSSAYFVSNCFEVYKLMSNAGEKSGITDFSKIEKKIGLNIKHDILGKLGKNILLFYDGIDYLRNNDENYATPKLGFIINLVDNSNINANLEKFLNEIAGNSPKIIYYENVKIFQYNNPAQSDLGNENNMDLQKGKKSILYCYIDNFVIFSFNEQTLKNFIDSFSKNKSSYAVSNGIHSASTKFEIFTGKFLDEYYTYLAKYSGRSTLFNGFEVERKIKPLFDILKKIKRVDYFSKNENYTFSGDLKIIMDE
jgi:hypothetical protein